MEFNLDRVRANVRAATTEDLLDRVTVYRSGLEPDALPVIVEELRARGITPEAIVRHEEERREIIVDPAGVARTCAKCQKPAVTREWGWHWMFGKVPLFPRPYYFCDVHRLNADYDEKPSEQSA
jgi:hypothetical protein